ncbi:hypothetical protein KKA72_00535, partial [Patescibacteria group bacterium]|nr:hypothetical protein [Patescibacteria group bacterium]MBU1876825.1 hypothetical protein [Patescibacteria group bacterium]
MEIIFNICCLVAFFITSSAVIRFWKSYKRTGISQFKYFSLAFFSLSLAFLLFSFPNLILFNPFWIQIDFILADIIFLGAELFLIPAILSLIKYSDRIQKTFLLIISSMIVVYVLLNIFFFAP